ncbi:hypothetical protein D3C84_442420 [compost metagenome]
MLADQGCQTFATLGLQRGIEAQQHVIETHFRAATFFLLEPRAYPLSGVLQDCRIGGRQTVETGLEARHCAQSRVIGHFAFFPRLSHAIRRQASEAGANIQLLKQFIFGPGFYLFEPGFEIACLHLPTVDVFTRDALMTDGKQLVRPLTPRHFKFEQRSPSLLQTLSDQFDRLFAFSAVALTGEQTTNSRQQRCGPAPITAHPIQRIALHRVTKQSPVIAQNLAEQITVIGFQGLGKQAATVERVLAQHALTPTVDGRDSCFVHPLSSDVQTVCASGPLLGKVLFTQLCNQGIRRRCFIAEKSCGFGKTRSNTFAQLFGRGVGERHNEDLRR